MKKRIVIMLLFVLSVFAAPAAAQESKCVKCHRGMTPEIVNDWEMSKHNGAADCSDCHGSEHTSPGNVDKARLATAETCGGCHPDRLAEFKAGKHALAWAAVVSMPTTHWQPMALLQGQKGCTGCHKVGLKTEEQIRELRAAGEEYGSASCDACHTRHLFSRQEALSPQACRTCHMGMDHPQWEMYESSKHGVRYLLKQAGVLSGEVAAPKCQTCHLPGGTHENITAWGFLAVRLPMPDDEEWAKDRATILTGLGVLDPQGNPTARLDLVKQAKVARLDQESWQKKRDEMIKICGDCHSEKFARGELEKADDMIREADRLMAEGIRIVAGLYEDGILTKPESYAYNYPDILTFHDAPTEVEQELFLMFLKHRMRTFQGAFHMNPDYTLWYGWSEMIRDLTKIRSLAEEMRKGH